MGFEEEEGQGSRRRPWWHGFLAWLLGSDAGWVLGDLEERRSKRRGFRRHVSTLVDVVSVAAWALSRGHAWREGTMKRVGVRMEALGAGGWLDVLRQDARYAVATLRRDLSFTIVVILTLALGIGAATAVFSVVHSILLKPLPYHDPDRLAMIWTSIRDRGIDDATSALANVRDWREQSSAFEDLATFDPTTRTLTGGPWPERVMTADVSANLFALLGVEPQLGRTFSADEERERAAVAVVSHELWHRRLGASPGAIGSTLALSGATLEVIGVMPESFGFPERGTEIWLPQTLLSGWDARESRRGTDSWRVVGRLGPGSTLEAARTELSEIASRLDRAYPTENAGLGARVVSLHDEVTGSSLRLALWTLFGAVGLVLLVACANAAHLTLARSVRRARERSIRVALGATSGRLARLALTESLVISTAAGVVGVLLATLAVDVMVFLAPADTPRIDEVAMSGMVLAFGLGLSVASTAVFGLGSATRRARGAPFDELREGRGAGRGARQGRRLLVVGQLALAVILTFGANLLIESFLEARGVDLGFDPSGVLLANLSVDSPEDRVAFYEQVVERVGALPGVEAVGIVEDVFISGAPNLALVADGRAAAAMREEVRIDAVDGDLFATLGVPILEGRAFLPADGPTSPPVAIVNESLARRLWPFEPAVGKRFATGDPEAGAPWIEVVGVVPDMRRQGFERAPIAQAFRPYAQAPSRSMNLLVRTDGSFAGLPAAVRAAVAEIDAAVPLYRVTTVADALDTFLGPRRSQTVLLGVFSAVALLLAAIGIYGLVQYSVATRMREMGVRLALGARMERLVAMVLGEGLVLALTGLALGAGMSLAIARVAGALLFGVTPFDIGSMVTTSAVLLATTMVACWVPARRAGRTDPVVALQNP